MNCIKTQHYLEKRNQWFFSVLYYTVYIYKDLVLKLTQEVYDISTKLRFFTLPLRY